MPTLKRLSDSEITAVKRLLVGNGLPADDCEHPDNYFFGFYRQGLLVACGGLQAAGSAVLLRSVVVADACQGNGLGRQLVNALLQQASNLGFSEVFLLTETAAGYFESLGFRHVERSEVPVEIKSTEQFNTLCPASADSLMKVLGCSEKE